MLLAGPPLMGSTDPSAHQQAPSTMARLYGRGAQCCWGKVTNTCGVAETGSEGEGLQARVQGERGLCCCWVVP
jgi:hypothetical protein